MYKGWYASDAVYQYIDVANGPVTVQDQPKTTAVGPDPKAEKNGVMEASDQCCIRIRFQTAKD